MKMQGVTGWLRCGLLAGWLAAASAGCAYMNVRTPMDTNFDRTELGAKEGRSSIYTALWLVSWGDGGTKAAAQQGGIKVIQHADVEMYSVLFGLYSRVSTIVYGD
jgi:hypothetical protein